MNHQRTHSTWWPPVCFAVGAGLITAGVVSFLVSGPSNLLAFVMLLILGLIPVAAACGIGAYEAARAFASAPAAAAIGVVAGLPPLLPLLGGGGIVLAGTALYTVVVAVAHLAVIRSRPSAVFAGMAVVAAVGAVAIAGTT